MLKKSFGIVCVLFASSALSNGCDCSELLSSDTDPIPTVHETKLYVKFSGSSSHVTSPDPLPGEIVDVRVDGKLEGTATSAQDFYETIDTGTHVIELKSHLVNSTYTTTHMFVTGDQFTYYFNCGDAHVTFNTDFAWTAAGVTQMVIRYHGKENYSSLPLLPGEQAATAVDVQAGSSVTVYDQNAKLLKTVTMSVPYDATTPFTISYP